jgi:hypothetical protein
MQRNVLGYVADTELETCLRVIQLQSKYLQFRIHYENFY